MTPDSIHAHAMGVLLSEPIADARADRVAERTAQRAAHTAALGPVDWVRRATEYEQAMTLARQANHGLAADLDHMAKLLAVAQKAAERWLIEAQENAEMAKMWRARAIAAERKR